MSVVTATVARTSALLVRGGTILHSHRTTTGMHQVSKARLSLSSASGKRYQQTSSTTASVSKYLTNNSGSGSKWRNNSLLTPGAYLLLAAALLSSSTTPPAEASWWPFSGAGWRRRKSSSPFDDTIPRKATKQRADAEITMRAYLERMRAPVQELVLGLREGRVRFVLYLRQ